MTFISQFWFITHTQKLIYYFLVLLLLSILFTFLCITHYLTTRAVRRRRRAAAADRMSAWRRRRFRDVFTSFLLYTSYMLLDFCNAVYNEAWTLTKSSKNDAGVLCNSPWYSDETRRRQSKSVFVDHFVKIKADAKSFVWNFFANLVSKADGTMKNFNSVYRNNCL